MKKSREQWLGFAAGAFFLLAALSQAKVQVFDRGRTLARARETQRYEMSRLEYARRGTILAADGRALAEDQDAFMLGISFAKVPHSDAFFMDLSQASGIPASEFAQLASSTAPSRTWKQEMSPLQARAIGRVKSEWRADGVSLARVARRLYPLGSTAAGVVGAILESPDIAGKMLAVSGLERADEKVLAGRDGRIVGLLDRTGAFLPMRVEAGSKERIDGKPVLTTIDSSIQEAAAIAVKDAVVRHKATNGVAIVMDPKTGDVLAMANYPSFDPTIRPNVAQVAEAKTDLNPAIKQRFEPGSTFKVLTLAKAIDVDAIDLHDRYTCTGQMAVAGSKPFHCDKRHGAHGSVDAEEAIARSCNISAARWALAVGYDDMLDYVEKLGLLKPTDVGLLGEVHGQFRDDEPAWQLQTAHLGFGQSITATPIELCDAFAMIANHGVRMQARLVQKVGRTINPVRELGQAVKPESADIVRKIMESVIETDQGTGKTLRIPGYRLAGKTGTAQKIGKNMSGYVSNFVGFVPASEPRAVILVMINDPREGYYGAQVAGPVFHALAKSVIRRFNIPPTESIAVHPSRKGAGAAALQ